MTRLRPPPTMLAPRVLLLCFALAEAIIVAGGGTQGDVFGLFLATFPLHADGPSALWVLLGRVCTSLVLIAGALAVALSVALALAVLLTALGGRAARAAGWAGRAITCVPPMAWALAAIALLIRAMGLPVETLFPYHPPPALDSWTLRAGRELWAWLVPLLALAAPAAGAGLFTMSHHLSSMLDDQETAKLRSRGLARTQMVYRHLVPKLRVHLARLGRPLAAMLLGYDIAVEHLLGFDGWGRFVAAQVLSPEISPRSLGVAMWTGGWILAVLLGLISLLDRRGLPVEAEDETDSAQRRSRGIAIFGAALATGLGMLPLLAARDASSVIGGASLAWMSEVPRAALAAGGALVLVVVAGFFMSLMPGHLISRGWAAALGNTPLLAAVLLWQSVEDAPLIIAMGALALPGIAALRETFHEANESDFIQASFSLGRTRFGIWKSHVLPGTLPGLLNWTLRNAATALIMLSAVDFFSLKEGPAQSWGRMMRDGAGGILDDAPAVLVPALLVALWGLSFRLLSRAFETETPQPRT